MMFLHLLLLPASAFGHGNMVWPPVWWDARGETGLKENTSCNAGSQYTFRGDPHKTGANCFWFNNDTEIVGAPTLDRALWTFPDVEPWAEKRLERHPWRAPGSAALYSPCGVAGGNPLGCPKGAAPGPGGDCHNGGFSYGPKAEEMDFEDPVTTEWIAGKNQVVGWGIIANHGGGYSYRLCKLPEEGRIGLSEECFQQNPLKFASNVSWAQWGDDPSSKISFLANRTTQGTAPQGSQWTKNPIPACSGFWGGLHDDDDSCPEGLQFDTPVPGVFGSRYHFSTGPRDSDWFIMDEVEVPKEMTPGEYVLSFRWDSEQTAQVWSACSNIRVLKDSQQP